MLEDGVLFTEDFSYFLELQLNDFENSSEILMIERKNREFVEQLLIQELGVISRRLMKCASTRRWIMQK